MKWSIGLSIALVALLLAGCANAPAERPASHVITKAAPSVQHRSAVVDAAPPAQPSTAPAAAAAAPEVKPTRRSFWRRFRDAFHHKKQP